VALMIGLRGPVRLSVTIGVKLAYAVVGTSPPVCWLGEPIWRHDFVV
jgi:hypothetical protein